MEAVRVETQPISNVVETPQVPESVVPATSVIETSVDTTLPGNTITQPNEVAAVPVVKEEPIVTTSILGYAPTEKLEEGKVLTTGEFAAALAAQKASGTNIDDLPLAV